MKKIKAVIFDLDNTLVDFISAKLKSCEEVCKVANCGNAKKLFEYFLSGKHGFESHENIADFLKDHGVFNEELYKKCCEIYEKIKIEKTEAYPGIKEVLIELKKRGLKLAVVTDAEKDQAVKRLKKAEILDYFDIIITFDVSRKKKPEPDSVILALENLKVGTEEAIIVGDSIRRDIEVGKKLGMITVYAAYGDWRFFEKVKADYKIDSPRELLKILDNLL
ncbi:MAG: HAD family hydrolase [Archaeoglobaceae archaeon]|nr:HAD family hydrolase [Archaeoglobaceae archaeon]MCX8151579.1 HAD family hydrolase [Archaeoglobaceae archaeon]MDW8013143.1 HAD family hydrolase [Archaeoglobaceae archaeon]